MNTNDDRRRATPRPFVGVVQKFGARACTKTMEIVKYRDPISIFIVLPQLMWSGNVTKN